LPPADFRLFDGPACATGEACPDFSASAAPMRFGYWRIVFAAPGQSAAHGIDNWKVRGVEALTPQGLLTGPGQPMQVRFFPVRFAS
jgi:hypothetical protein